MTKQVIQIVAIHLDGSKITMVRTDKDKLLTVDELRHLMEKGESVVTADDNGNVAAVGPRDETMISSVSDDTIFNNLRHLPKF